MTDQDHDQFQERLKAQLGPLTVERIRAAEAQAIEALSSRAPSRAALLKAFLMSDEERAEWEAADCPVSDEQRAAEVEREERRIAELAILKERMPELGDGGYRMLELALARMDGLAFTIAESLGWEHSEQVFQAARDKRRAFIGSMGTPSTELPYEDWEQMQMEWAYVDAVEARRAFFEGGAIWQVLERLTSAASSLLQQSPQERRREDARAAANTGWEWREPVLREAFRRREIDLRADPVKYKERAKSIRKMLPEIRAMYDELGRVRNVTLAKEETKAMRTINKWFVDAKRP